MELKVHSRPVPLSVVTVPNGIAVPRVILAMAVRRANLVGSLLLCGEAEPFSKIQSCDRPESVETNR